MEHIGSVRPQLPGTTAAPGPAGRKSVYSTRLPPSFTENGNNTNRGMGDVVMSTSSRSPTTRPAEGNVMQSRTLGGGRLDGPPPGLSMANMAASGKAGTLRVIQEKTISKLTAKLPNQLRSTVTAVVEMAFASTDDVQRQLDMSRFEVCALREQLSKRNQDVTVLNKTSDILREKIVQLEDSISVLKDNIETNQKHDVKNKAAMHRLASTNRMLFDSLEALQADTDAAKKLTKGGGADQQRAPPGLLLTSQSTKHMSPSKRFAPENEESLFQNDKLRESLLRVTREHYKFMKYAENLDRKVTELRGSLRSQEQLNRKLKAEVDEYRALLRTDDVEEKGHVSGEVGSIRSKQKNHSMIDARLQDMIEHNGFDPIDGIQLLRRILAHMATSPNDLSLKNMIKHIVAQESLRIFCCDMICLYIKPPNGDGSMLLRYTVKSPQPVEVKYAGATSLAAEVMKSGKVTRINVLDGTCFNIDIDCVAGVLAKRVMSLPLYNTESKEVYGCMHMINKQHNDLYSDVDELFGLIFADQSSLLLTSCMMFDSISYHSELLQSLLESSTALFSVIPDPNSLAVSRSLSPGVILTAIESIAKELLKCSDARAFLVSDYVGMGSGRLVMLERANLSSVSKEVQINSLLTPPIHSGIAGYVVQSRSIHEMNNTGYDTYVNPTVDIDPLMSSMIALPIMDLYGTVVGCIELVVGPRSPGVRQTSSNGSTVTLSSAEGLSFIQTAQWFIHQITTPLQYLLNFIGRPVTRPISTPSRIARTPGNSKSTKARPFFGYALDGVDEKSPTSSLPMLAAFNSAIAAGDAPGGGTRVKFPVPDNNTSDDFVSLPLTEIKPAETIEAATDQANDSSPSPKRAADEQKLRQLQDLHEQQQGQIEILQKKFQDGTSEIASLQGEVDAYKSLLDSLREELEEERAKSADATAAVRTASDDHQQSKALEDAKKEIEELKVKVEQQKEEIAAKAATDDALEALDRALAKQTESEKTIEELRTEIAAVNDARIHILEELSTSHQETERLTDEITKLRESSAKAAMEEIDVTALKEEQSKLKSEVDTLTSRCTTAETEVQEKMKLLQQLEEDLKISQSQCESLQKEKSDLATQLDEHTASAGAAVSSSSNSEEITVLKNSNTELEKKVQELEATLAQKETIQKALQEQVVKMAGQNVLSPTAGAATVSDAESLLFGASSPPPGATAAPAVSLAEELLFGGSPKKNVFSSPAPHSGAPASTAEELLFGALSPKPNSSSAAPPTSSGAASAAEELLFGTSKPTTAGNDSALYDMSDDAGRSGGNGSEWSKQIDDYGNVYYYNPQTGESSWTNPNDPPEADGSEPQYNSDGLLQKGDWVQNFDDSGTPYWVNQITGESSWSIP